MAGFGGFGSTGGEKSSTGNLNNIFSYGLGTAQKSQDAGSSDLSTAGNFFNSLLTAGRTQTAQNAAPAVNSVLAQSDARKRQEASTGTGRTGGTAELNRNQGTTTQSTIDNILNQQLNQQKQAGAQGLENTGSTLMSQVAPLLGLASGTQNDILNANVQKGGQQSNFVSSLFQALI